MGSLTKAFGTSEEKENEGVWVDLAVNDDESIARIKIRRMGQSNKKFTKRFASLAKKFRTMRGSKNELEKKALRETFCETCIVEWDNIENINEVPEGQKKEKYMPFSVENANKLFHGLPELFEFIVGEAMDLQTFQDQDNEDTAKNSFPTSSTNSP